YHVSHVMPPKIASLPPQRSSNPFPATIKDGDALDASGSATDGIIKINRVCNATYTVTETTPPPGYSNDPVTDHKRTCIVAEPDQTCSVTFSDPLGNLTINKVDADTQQKLTGAVFTISPNPFACHQPADTFPATIKE